MTNKLYFVDESMGSPFPEEMRNPDILDSLVLFEENTTSIRFRVVFDQAPVLSEIDVKVTRNRVSEVIAPATVANDENWIFMLANFVEWKNLPENEDLDISITVNKNPNLRLEVGRHLGFQYFNVKDSSRDNMLICRILTNSDAYDLFGIDEADAQPGFTLYDFTKTVTWRGRNLGHPNKTPKLYFLNDRLELRFDDGETFTACRRLPLSLADYHRSLENPLHMRSHAFFKSYVPNGIESFPDADVDLEDRLYSQLDGCFFETMDRSIILAPHPMWVSKTVEKIQAKISTIIPENKDHYITRFMKSVIDIQTYCEEDPKPILLKLCSDTNHDLDEIYKAKIQLGNDRRGLELLEANREKK